jgi:hypothetical protein
LVLGLVRGFRFVGIKSVRVHPAFPLSHAQELLEIRYMTLDERNRRMKHGQAVPSGGFLSSTSPTGMRSGRPRITPMGLAGRIVSFSATIMTASGDHAE